MSLRTEDGRLLVLLLTQGSIKELAEPPSNCPCSVCTREQREHSAASHRTGAEAEAHVSKPPASSVSHANGVSGIGFELCSTKRWSYFVRLQPAKLRTARALCEISGQALGAPLAERAKIPSFFSGRGVRGDNRHPHPCVICL